MVSSRDHPELAPLTHSPPSLCGNAPCAGRRHIRPHRGVQGRPVPQEGQPRRWSLPGQRGQALRAPCRAQGESAMLSSMRRSGGEPFGCWMGGCCSLRGRSCFKAGLLCCAVLPCESASGWRPPDVCRERRARWTEEAEGTTARTSVECLEGTAGARGLGAVR